MSSSPIEDVPLPPASETQGGSHDLALAHMRGIQLIHDRALGLTYEQLAQKHGYRDGSGARHALLRALDRHEHAQAAHLRAIENERYEMDQAELRAIITNRALPVEQRIRAIDARTRSATAHARLNGLNAPVQVSILNGMQAALAELSELVLGEAEVIGDEPIDDETA